MNGWAVFGKVVAGLIVVTTVGMLLVNMKDVERYLKIANM